MNLKTHLWPKWSLLMEINWQMPIISLTYALLHVCIKFDWLGLRNKRQIWKSSFLAYFANVQFSDLIYEHVLTLFCIGDHPSRLSDFDRKISIKWDVAYARDLVSFQISMKFCRSVLNSSDMVPLKCRYAWVTTRSAWLVFVVKMGYCLRWRLCFFSDFNEI